MSKIKVALFGHGHLGKWHAQKINQHNDCELSLIVDPHLSVGSRIYNELIKIYPNTKLVEVFNPKDDATEFDAAIISAPTSQHFEISKTLVELNKHVFCEKPMTQTFEQALELSSSLKNSKSVFQVGHSERYHQVWNDKDLFKSHISNNSLLSFKRVAPSKGRATDVSVVEDLMIHDVDLMLFLSAELPKAVRAKGLKNISSNFDHVRCLFDFENGMEVVIEASRTFYDEVRLFEATSPYGSLGVDLFRQEIKEFVADKKEVTQSNYQRRDHLLLEQNDFYQSILKNSSPQIGFKEGLLASFLLDKINKALTLPAGEVISLDYTWMSSHEC